jgi:MFS family permease
MIYLMLCPFMFWLSAKLSKPAVIFIGLLMLSVSMLLIGTSPTLGIEKSANMIFFGLMVMGVAAPFVSIPVLPDILEATFDKENDIPHSLLNKISSIFVMATEIGNASGPMLSSVMKD